MADVFREFVMGGANTEFVAIERDAAELAARIRAEHSLSLTDAFQVATAICANCDAILTNDKKFKRLAALDVVVLEEIDGG